MIPAEGEPHEGENRETEESMLKVLEPQNSGGKDDEPPTVAEERKQDESEGNDRERVIGADPD